MLTFRYLTFSGYAAGFHLSCHWPPLPAAGPNRFHGRSSGISCSRHAEPARACREDPAEGPGSPARMRQHQILRNTGTSTRGTDGAACVFSLRRTSATRIVARGVLNLPNGCFAWRMIPGGHSEDGVSRRPGKPRSSRRAISIRAATSASPGRFRWYTRART